MPTTGPSMLPNMKNTYYILARDYYLKNNINYGDVVIIEPSIKTRGISLVKRVVGLSDDKVQIKNGYLFNIISKFPSQDSIAFCKKDQIIWENNFLESLFFGPLKDMKENMNWIVLINWV